MLLSRLAAVVLLCSLCGCSATSLSTGDAPLTGAWGGAHVSLTLTSSGGTIAYDCAHGALRGALIPDGAGDFNVTGVHVRERGGPVRIGEIPDSVSARYFGRVSGDRMTLRVLAGADTLGPFELELGAAPQLYRCL